MTRLLVLLLPLVACGNTPTIEATPLTLLAGRAGHSGSADGAGDKARFYSPQGIASDGAGNLYLTEDLSCTIRKVVLATGEVTTIAGMAGVTGSQDGIGAEARFFSPEGIATDGEGNLYVADLGNSTIRKVVIESGEVTTLAGVPGQVGSEDGIGSQARFRYVTGVANDGAGNLYVADSLNHSIRKIAIATGEVTTLINSLFLPWGVATDGAGSLYLADTAGDAIRKIVLATGEMTTLAGGQQGELDGVGSAAQFNAPKGIAIDGAGSLYVADSHNKTIRKIDLATAAVSTPIVLSASFNEPIFLVAAANELVLSDAYEDTLVIATP